MISKRKRDDHSRSPLDDECATPAPRKAWHKPSFVAVPYTRSAPFERMDLPSRSRSRSNSRSRSPHHRRTHHRHRHLRKTRHSRRRDYEYSESPRSSSSNKHQRNGRRRYHETSSEESKEHRSSHLRFERPRKADRSFSQTRQNSDRSTPTKHIKAVFPNAETDVDMFECTIDAKNILRGVIDSLETEENHLDLSVGDWIGKRYEVKAELGKGHFSNVFKCVDHFQNSLTRNQNQDYNHNHSYSYNHSHNQSHSYNCSPNNQKQVAVKVIRAIKKYIENSQIEIEILQDIKRADPNGSSVVHLERWFVQSGHVCIVMPLYGTSIFDYMEANGTSVPFPLDDVREHLRCLLNALVVMHSIGYVHTDLKPENIVFKDPVFDDIEANVSDPKMKFERRYRMLHDQLRVRVPICKRSVLCDLGNAVRVTNDPTNTLFNQSSNHRQPHQHQRLLYGHNTTNFKKSIIATRHYRAPEVMLELGWSFPSDIWSVGLIAIELYTSNVVFRAQHDREQIKMMERLVGRFPKWMIKHASNYRRCYFSHSGKVIFPEPGVSETSKYVDAILPLERLISSRECPAFVSFVEHCLDFDPTRRPSASEALKHRFFDGVD